MAGTRNRMPVGQEDLERRQLLQELRDQRHHVQRHKEVLCDIDTNRLDEAVRRLDHAVDKGALLKEQKAKEVSAQADILRQLAACGAEAITKLVQQQQGRGPVELINVVRAMFVHSGDPQRDGQEDPRAFQWAEFGAHTMHLRRTVRGMHSLLGPMDAKPKERKAPVQRQKRQAPGELLRPEEYKEEEETDKQDTDRNMELMWEIIQAQRDPVVPVAELVLNHASFAQTIENIFTLSFLVRDNRVAMMPSDNGLCVRALDMKKADKAAGPGGKQQAAPHAQTQFIVSMHEDDWLMMRQVVRREHCLMPHRQPQEAGGAASRGAAQGNKKQRRQQP